MRLPLFIAAMLMLAAPAFAECSGPGCPVNQSYYEYGSYAQPVERYYTAAEQLPSGCPPGGCPVEEVAPGVANNTCGCNCAACNCGSAESRGTVYANEHSVLTFRGQPVRNVLRAPVRAVRGTVHWFGEHRPVRRALVGVARVATAPIRFVARGPIRHRVFGCSGCR